MARDPYQVGREALVGLVVVIVASLLLSGATYAQGVALVSPAPSAAGSVVGAVSAATGAAASGPTAFASASLPEIGGVFIVPQRHAYRLGDDAGQLAVLSVQAWVTIVDRKANTALEIHVMNPGDRAQEAELLVPVPSGAVPRSFSFQGSVPGATATLLERDQARATYESIVSRLKDPALLEFAGQAALRTSVFPVPAGGDQRVRIVYDELLSSDGDRIEYVLPRSHASLAAWTPWSVKAWIKAPSEVTAIWSPSHPVQVERLDGGVIAIDLDEQEAKDPGPFVLDWMARDAGISASFMACPDAAVGGGHVMLVAGLPATLLAPGQDDMPRDVTVVLDRSGSMKGQKIAQALAAARQVLEGLTERDAFNLIVYNAGVESLAPAPRPMTPAFRAQARSYLTLVTATGGTNLHEGLLTALRQPVRPGALPVVLFVSDGLPTEGVTAEAEIRAAARDANAQHARVFTFGVGDDVNAPLLDALAMDTRGASHAVLPGQDVEAEVSRVYDQLTGPVFANPRLAVLRADGTPAVPEVRDIQPAELPDLFAGDQLQVFALYAGTRPLRFELRGELAGRTEVLGWTFDPAHASPANAFVPRLWAARKIAALIDEVRQAGATPGQAPDDPRLAEVTEEIVALSLEHGVLTEYTAFLAEQGTDLTRIDDVRTRTRLELAGRAQQVRTGRQAVVQAANLRDMRRRLAQAGASSFLDRNLQRVSVAGVSRVGDRTFFQRDGAWIDSELLRLRAERARAAAAVPADGGAPVAAATAAGGSAQAAEPVPADGATPADGAAAAVGASPRDDLDRTVRFGTPEYLAVSRELSARGWAGALALGRDLQLLLDGEALRVLAP